MAYIDYHNGFIKTLEEKKRIIRFNFEFTLSSDFFDNKCCVFLMEMIDQM